MKLTEKELMEVVGGTLTATLTNAIARCAETFFTIGRAIGSAIRRISSKTICEVK